MGVFGRLPVGGLGDFGVVRDVNGDVCGPGLGVFVDVEGVSGELSAEVGEFEERYGVLWAAADVERQTAELVEVV